MRTEKHGRNWAVYDDGGALICLTTYRKGAREVVRVIGAARLAPVAVAADRPTAPGEYPTEESLRARTPADLVQLQTEASKNPVGSAARECAVRTYLGIW